MRKAIIRDTGWSLLAEVVRLLSGTVSFLLVAKTLGPEVYGQFAGIMAIVGVLSPFANFGASLLLTQRIKREQVDAQVAFSTSLSMTLVGAAVFTLVAVALARLFIGAPVLPVLLIAANIFFLSGLIQLGTGLSISHDDIRWYAIIVAAGAVATVGISLAFWLLNSSTLVQWASLQMAGLTVVAVSTTVVTARRFRVRPRLVRFDLLELRQGVPYSASIAVFNAQDGIDKPLMVRYGWGIEAGLYAVAYQIPSLVFIPVQALIVATLGRSFEAGREGITGSLRLAKRLVLPALGYATIGSLVMVLASPIFKPLFGDSFADAVSMMRWAAFIPIVRTLQYFPANALTGAGRQTLRLKLLGLMLVLNGTLCVTLIPSFSWRGALVATFVGEMYYAIALWVVATVLARREKRALLQSVIVV